MISYPWDSIVEAIGDDGFPIYDRDYKAADLQSLNGRIFSNGVFMDEPDAFVVTPAEGMNVLLSQGWCCINGTFGHEPNMRELAIQSSAATQDRIDTVVLRWNANIEMRNIDVYVKTGVASDVPVRPTLTRDSTVYELGIADIFVPRGSGAISAARITDTRLQTDRCGAVTPFATIDTTSFYDHLQAVFDEMEAELEEQTQTAVELAQSALDGTTAGNLQSQIDSIWETVYPVGALYLSFVSTSPAQLFGGSWTQISGCFLRAASDTNTGGADTVTLTTAQMPSHSHLVVSSNKKVNVAQGSSYTTPGLVNGVGSDSNQRTGEAGNSESFSNLPSYQNIYVWRRIDD